MWIPGFLSVLERAFYLRLSAQNEFSFFGNPCLRTQNLGHTRRDALKNELVTAVFRAPSHLNRMASETFSVRMYFALLLAGIAGFAALVIATVQSDIATATVSQEGLSVQLVVSSFCSILYRLTQMNILSGINDAYDGKALNTLRYRKTFI